MNLEKPDYLNDKQYNFLLNYLQTGHITQSAIDAGYSKKTAHIQGSRFLSSVKGKKFIADVRAAEDAEKIATTEEVLQYLTSVMRGEVKDQFDLEPALVERTRAAVELSKRLIDNQPITATVTIVNDIPMPKRR